MNREAKEQRNNGVCGAYTTAGVGKLKLCDKSMKMNAKKVH